MTAPDLRAEAELYVRWLRGAAGRFQWGEAKPSSRTESPSLVATADARPALVPVPVPVASSSAVRAPGAPADSRLPAASADRVASPAATEDADPFDRLRVDALACRRCRLCETRSTVVFGEGSRRPRLMVIGEAPGADEDATGKPFVGKAGQLLTKMLAAIGLAREDVFIGNVLKCRPPGNRPPAPDEAAACRPFLDEQIRLLEPDLLLLLGNHATQAVLGTDRGISSLRGQILRAPDGRPALPTFHPAYLLRSPEKKREAWLDLQLAAKTLGLSIPPPRRGADADPQDDGTAPS